MDETAHLPAMIRSEPSVGVASPMLHVQGIDDDLPELHGSALRPMDVDR